MNFSKWDFTLNPGGIAGGLIVGFYAGYVVFCNINPGDLARFSAGRIIIIAIILGAYAGNLIWQFTTFNNGD